MNIFFPVQPMPSPSFATNPCYVICKCNMTSDIYHAEHCPGRKGDVVSDVRGEKKEIGMKRGERA